MSISAVEHHTHGRYEVILIVAYETPLAVEDIESNSAYMVAEHVGPLQVIVVLEGYEESAVGKILVFFHHAASGEQSNRHKCYKIILQFHYYNYIWCGCRHMAATQ